MMKVILEGAMGKEFGRDWELEATSVPEALRIINANKDGLFEWVRNSINEFPKYRIVCEYDDGRKEDLDNDTYFAERTPDTVYIVPIIEGANAGTRFVVGAVLAFVGYGTSFITGPAGAMVGAIGVSLMIGSVIETLSPKPSMNDSSSSRKDKTSYYFDGPVNTSVQGVPVPLIYGQIRAGSHAISAALTIDQLL